MMVSTMGAEASAFVGRLCCRYIICFCSLCPAAKRCTWTCHGFGGICNALDVLHMVTRGCMLCDVRLLKELSVL